jgi:hypothetical protein
MTTAEKRKVLVQELKKYMSTDQIKRFSENLRRLNIVDLKDDEQFERAAAHEFAFMMSLITYQQFGLLDKLVEIQRQIQGEDNGIQHQVQ